MSKIPSPPLQMESWANYLGGFIFLLLHKKWSFPLRISSVIVTKSARSCGFGHIYWRNPWWKTSFFVQHPFQKKLYILSISFFICFSFFIWIRGFRLELSFTSQSESYSVPDMDFFIISSIILSQLPFSRTELPKLTPSVSIEHFDHFSGQFYFYMLQPIRLDFSKVYLQARCIFI